MRGLEFLEVLDGFIGDVLRRVADRREVEDLLLLLRVFGELFDERISRRASSKAAAGEERLRALDFRREGLVAALLEDGELFHLALQQTLRAPEPVNVSRRPVIAARSEPDDPAAP
jgi:hypothetical protein